MSIPSYLRPQVLLRQQLAAVSSATIKNQNAFIFGPNFYLRRYTETDERALIAAGAYDPDNDADLAYPNQPASSVVDLAYTRLWMRDAWLQYFVDEVGSGSVINVFAAAHRNKVRAASLVFKTANGATRSSSFLRDVAVGDRVFVRGTVGGTDYDLWTRVVDLQAEIVAATKADPLNASANQATQTGSTLSGVTVTKVGSSTDLVGSLTGTYKTDLVNGLVGDTYTITCTTGGGISAAKFRITSASGTVDVSDVSAVIDSGSDLDDAYILNSALRGIQFDFAGTASAFVAGEQWLFTVKAAFTKLVQTTNMTAGGTYVGAVDTSYVLTVTEGGAFGTAKVRITDSQGSDASSEVTVSMGTAITLGANGVTVTFLANSNTEGGDFTNGGLRLGDSYEVVVTAAGEGAIRTLVLADNVSSSVAAADEASPTDLQLKLYIYKAEVEVPVKRLWDTPEYNFIAAAGAVTVKAGIKLQDSGWSSGGSMPWLPLVKGTQYVHYRALNTLSAGVILTITSPEDIAEVGEKVDVEDPLTYGVNQALKNSGDRVVYYARVPTNDLAGYQAVLNVASQTKKVYAFGPTTDDDTINEAVIAHVNSLSTETTRKWRKTYLPTKLITVSTVVEKDVAGDNFLGTLTGTGNKTLTVTNGQLLTAGVRVGDILDINFLNDGYGEETYDSYTVASVSTETTALIATGPSAPISVPVKIRIRRNLTKDEQAALIAAKSASYANRRVAHVFPPVSYLGGVLQTGWAMSCAIAGLRSSVVPQQGLTNAEVLGVDDIPMTYQYFNNAQLDVIAASGTYIIAQDEESGTCYVRHQLTTDTTSILTREDSATTNLDSMAYYILERLEAFIGKYNVTPKFLERLRTELEDSMDYLSSTTQSSDLNIGPQLISGSILQLAIVAGAQDRVAIKLNLTGPVPCNILDTTLAMNLET